MGIDLSEFYKSVEWDILGVPAARYFVGDDDHDDVIHDDEVRDDGDNGDLDLDAAYDDNDDAWNLINGRLIKGTRPYIGHL